MNKFDLYMKKMGFMKYEAYTNDYEDQDIELLKEIGIEKEIFFPVVYERKLSTFTSFIVEGEYKRGLYYYDFYKIRYHYHTKEITEIKVYCLNVGEHQLLNRIKEMLVYCKMLSSDTKIKLNNLKIEIYHNNINGNQKDLDNERKSELGVL